MTTENPVSHREDCLVCTDRLDIVSREEMDADLRITGIVKPFWLNCLDLSGRRGPGWIIDIVLHGPTYTKQKDGKVVQADGRIVQLSFALNACRGEDDAGAIPASVLESRSATKNVTHLIGSTSAKDLGAISLDNLWVGHQLVWQNRRLLSKECLFDPRRDREPFQAASILPIAHLILSFRPS